LADGCLCLLDIDNGTGLDAARKGMSESDDVDGVAAITQDLIRGPRLEAPDETSDFAGADIKRGDHGRALRARGFIFGVMPNARPLMRRSPSFSACP
jgi:hypothetical protein